ncbi:hypothetical protein GJ496_008687, partial [Pomphorhynchus laevis]
MRRFSALSDVGEVKSRSDYSLSGSGWISPS